MKVIKRLWKLRLSLIVFLCFHALPAKTNSVVKTSNDVIFNCIEDEPLKYFCTNVPVTNPTIVLQLSRFERKKYRGMLTHFGSFHRLLTERIKRLDQLKFG